MRDGHDMQTHIMMKTMSLSDEPLQSKLRVQQHNA
jgi:hypothetical protein